jgi:predicted HTH transcriptional regulator
MELEGEVERHGLHPRTMGALFDAAIRLRVRNASYRSVLEDWGEEISNQVATSDLRDLVNAGLLEQRGKKRGTFYVAGETIGAIRERAQADRKPITADRLFRKEA